MKPGSSPEPHVSSDLGTNYAVMSHYRSLNSWLRDTFGEKVYKLALDGGFTCPTRDGSISRNGCIFCAGGSGDFSVSVDSDISEAIERAKILVHSKGAKRYIAYYQSYTGTYAPIGRLKELYFNTVLNPDIVALSIGTRPDCLGNEVLDLLTELNRIKPVWIELGLQTIHSESAEYIRRGYSLQVFDDAVKKLLERKLTVIVHMIIGLPGETPEMMRQTAEYIGSCGAHGIKFQLLHILKGTDLAKDYYSQKFHVLSLEEYIRILEACIESIPPEMIVHRLTGDGAKKRLIAPLWSGDKKYVLNEINRVFDRDHVIQGKCLSQGRSR